MLEKGRMMLKEERLNENFKGTGKIAYMSCRLLDEICHTVAKLIILNQAKIVNFTIDIRKK